MRVRVLIVDDEEKMRNTLLDYMTKALDCEAVALPDTKSAMDAIEGFKPDLILTDYDMPGANGLELIRQAKALVPHTMMVMMTACQKIETAVEAMKMGACDYITKPFNLYQLDLLMMRVSQAKENIKPLEQMESEYIETVIAQCGSVAEAAVKLGINPSTIWRKRKKAG
jgi:two-component system response regulator AtoC